MSSVASEPHITPSALSRQVCLEGESRPVHTGTVIRWITRGVRVRGQIVKLEALRLGGRWVTSTKALDRFMAKLTAATSAEPTPPPLEAQDTQDERDNRDLSNDGW